MYYCTLTGGLEFGSDMSKSKIVDHICYRVVVVVILQVLTFTHQFPLTAEAKGADRSEGRRANRGVGVNDAVVAETGLTVPTVLPDQ